MISFAELNQEADKGSDITDKSEETNKNIFGSVTKSLLSKETNVPITTSKHIHSHKPITVDYSTLNCTEDFRAPLCVDTFDSP